MPLALRPALVALALTLAACGKSERTADTDSAAAATADSAAVVDASAAAMMPAADAGNAASAPLAAADVDRWQRGMEAELKAVQEAGAKLVAARSGLDTLSAMNAATEASTRAAGAAGAGVSEDRYQTIRSTLDNLVGQMVPSEMETGGQMPATMVAQLKQGREAGLAQVVAQLPPELVEAVRPRAEALRRQSLQLVGERMKAAGLARR